MRSFVPLVIAAAALTAVGYLAVTPYFAFGALLNAAAWNDDAALARNVDYAALRESVAAQLRGSGPTTSGPFAALADAFTTEVTGVLADTIATPDGVRELLGFGPLSAWVVADVRTMHDQALRRYRAWDRFEVTVAQHHLTDGPLTYVFERRGLGWRLTGIAR